MNKFGFALVGAASLALAACGGAIDDNLNNVDTYGTNEDLNALATDAANEAEAEALGNQADQLNQESNAAADNAVDTTDSDENVAGM